VDSTAQRTRRASTMHADASPRWACIPPESPPSHAADTVRLSVASQHTRDAHSCR
jgi:hypothetical protein